VPDRTRHDQLRLMTLAARLYHERGLRQCDIAEQLGVSQPRVSRLLADAEKHGIVRTVVVTPDGYHPELEEAIEDAYGLRECHVVEVLGGDDAIPHELGVAAAQYFCASSLWGVRVGFSSWSSTLREMARRLGRVRRSTTTHVVEMLGHLAPPPLQHQAVRATLQLAQALAAEPVLLRAPGVVTDPALRQTVLRSPHVDRALSMLDDLDLAFVGVGPVDGLAPLRPADTAQLAAAQAAGAVGQLNQRFIDAAGHPVSTPLDDAVVAVTLSQLRKASTRAVVAGGPSKLTALHAALCGKWVDVLVTDLASARHLIMHAD
jgi:DNA-binding transcriptional regulator LsrR (DeoR family)